MNVISDLILMSFVNTIELFSSMLLKKDCFLIIFINLDQLNNLCIKNNLLSFIFSVFDDLLYRPKCKSDIDQYEEVQNVLRDNIVNPLRKNKFVQADKVMILRKLLDDLSSVSGLTSEEKGGCRFELCCYCRHY